MSYSSRTPEQGDDALLGGSPLRLYVVLSRAAEALHAHTVSDIESHGLTQTEFAILEALYHKGPMLLGEVQRKILVSSGGITFLIDKLVKRGLVQRRPCESDRRARFAELTPAGRDLIARIFPGHAEVIRRAVSGLSPAEQQTLTELLKKLGLSAAQMVPEPSGTGAQEAKG
ncbi:MAG TPA: MarR family transcriptional regulator [Gemmatimonadaceae bacterium]|nr:MarR family transcriptional regulator [Gemmatimonadaceae bacterium]HRQ77624.1 MarR family transcriptional regulator [Gemmatimonadaceae bacterium]